MIMSVHDPLSRKRDLGLEPLNKNKRRKENEQSGFSEEVYSIFVKLAMDSLEKVCLDRKKSLLFKCLTVHIETHMSMIILHM